MVECELDLMTCFNKYSKGEVMTCNFGDKVVVVSETKRHSETKITFFFFTGVYVYYYVEGSLFTVHIQTLPDSKGKPPSHHCQQLGA